MIDNVRGAKVAGSGFPVYTGAGSRLQRSLISWFLDVHTTEHGFTEVWPPAVVNTASARGTGQIPDKEDQMYVVTRDELYLVPTAEVPVTNLLRDEILEADQLPVRYAAYTPCWRREAGAAGKDTRGILRVHQFDKVEMVLFEKPEDSPEALEWMTGRAEVLLQRLGLPYRVLLMSTGEMGFVQRKKYDLEVWAPGVERWLEVSSCSNFGDYQARRMAIRYRPEKGAKPELVHTLNGSGLALPRIVASILEQYQNPDGTVTVPGGAPAVHGDGYDWGTGGGLSCPSRPAIARGMLLRWTNRPPRDRPTRRARPNRPQARRRRRPRPSRPRRFPPSRRPPPRPRPTGSPIPPARPVLRRAWSSPGYGARIIAYIIDTIIISIGVGILWFIAILLGGGDTSGPIAHHPDRVLDPARHPVLPVLLAARRADAGHVDLRHPRRARQGRRQGRLAARDPAVHRLRDQLDHLRPADRLAVGVRRQAPPRLDGPDRQHVSSSSS